MRRSAAAIVMCGQLTAAVLLGVVPGAWHAALATTDAPTSATTDAPTSATTDAPTSATTDAPTSATTEAPPTTVPPIELPPIELPEVEGAANPLQAPVLPTGQVTDTILQTEVLWYALPALPGQQVTVGVTVQGRPNGPASTTTVVEATVHDAQRLPVQQVVVPFDGQRDALAAPPVAEIPAVAAPRADGATALLSVALLPEAGQDDLVGVGYRVVLQVEVTGDPVPLSAVTAAASPPPPVRDAVAEPTPTSGASASSSSSSSPVADLLPVALVALAIGGVGGFELSRRGL